MGVFVSPIISLAHMGILWRIIALNCRQHIVPGFDLVRIRPSKKRPDVEASWASFRILRLEGGDAVVVSVEPIPGEEFILRIDALERVTKASYRVVKPNPGWADLEGTLGDEAGASKAAYADVGMTAKPRGTLAKGTGIVAHIKALFNKRHLGHAAIAGMREGNEDKFTTEQLGRKEFRAIQTDERGQVLPNDAYNKMEGVIDRDQGNQRQQ